MFGKKNLKHGKTLALVEVESGSVAAALVRLAPDEAPKLFAQTRIELPLLATRSSVDLSREALRAARKAIDHIAEVASRVRAHEELAMTGDIAHTAVFYAAPWAAMHLTGGTADYLPHMTEHVSDLVRDILGQHPSSRHPFGTAAAHGALSLFPFERSTLLFLVGGEVSELLLIEGGAVRGRATIPAGLSTILRTAMAHGGLSTHEARSLVTLASQSNTENMHEALQAAGSDFAHHFSDAAAELLAASPAASVIVVAPTPSESFFARSLAHHARSDELFPEGSIVQALRASQVAPHIAMHALHPDVPLMLEALFVDKKFGIY